MKHCPICKEGNIRLETDFAHKEDKYHVIYAHCPICGARTPSYPTMNQAQDAWESGNVTRGDSYQTNMFELSEAKNG